MYIKHINQTDRLCQSDPRQLPRLATRLSSRLPMSVKLSRQRTVSCLAAALFGGLQDERGVLRAFKYFIHIVPPSSASFSVYSLSG